MSQKSQKSKSLITATQTETQTKRIFLIAGETSGDLLAGRLMAALRELAPSGVSLEFDGIGGETMAVQGLQSRFPMEELSVFGLFAVLRHLPRLMRRIKETVALIKATKPDLVITIDAPAFGLRVTRQIAALGIPRIHYVAPQHWAWLRGRARQLRFETDLLLALLPFEPVFFAAYGVECQFVGHSVIESAAARQSQPLAQKFRRNHHIGNDQPLMLLLPGSRHSELQRLLPIFLMVVDKLQVLHPRLKIVMPLAAAMVESVKAQIGVRAISLLPNDSADDAEKYAAFAAADFALAASGTVTLELALCLTPTVVAYRFDRPTWWIARWLIKTRQVALANIVGGREIMPERIQNRCTVSEITAALLPLIPSGTGAIKPSPANLSQRAGLAKVATALKQGDQLPSYRAAKIVLQRLLYTR